MATPPQRHSYAHPQRCRHPAAPTTSRPSGSNRRPFMIEFFLWAGALLAVAYLLFIPALLGKSGSAVPAQAVPLLLYRQRCRELQQELEQGSLEPEAFEQLSRELDLQLLADSADASGPHPNRLRPPRFALPAGEGLAATAPRSQGRWPVLLALLVLPFLAYGLYAHLGRPDLLDAPANLATAPDSKTLNENIQRLAQRLENTPDDLQGWMLLARSYQVTQQADKAQAAYRKAMALAPDNLDVKALYAQAVAESQGNRLQGRPAQLVADILAADPNHPTGLWLAGLAAAERGDAQAALGYWQKLKEQYPADSEEAKQLSGYMAVLGEPVAAPASAPKLSLTVNVSLAPSLAGKAQAEDTLLVFAKAVDGPPMPLAIVRKQVKDLPLTVTLDDSMSMAPGMSLSAFPQIQLGARISKSGQAMPAAGDLQGLSAPIAPVAGQTYTVEITQPVP
ncbi:MAG: c-type cytochrome biogenesis protein CcmI [Methylococcaceae bacterium]|nr:MAG: c-type cytochrome biogenesis protein CcmI [Methylococcaceae bacterium]